MEILKNQKIRTTVIDYALITIGMTLYVLGWSLFLIPARITGGGVSGIAALILYATEDSMTFLGSPGIPVWFTYLIINIGLILVALRILGASFGVKTIWCLAVATILFKVMEGVVAESIVGDDKFLSAVIGGILGGAGIGLVFTRGGSTGGTDIIAMIINKYRNISPGRIILYCDVIIVSLSYFVSHNPAQMVYGFVTMWVVSSTIDSLLSGSNASAQIFIFSKDFREIADYINHDASRGCTIIDGTGWYSKENVKIVMTVIRKKESSMVFRKIKEIDPQAFISMGSVMGVYGEGFDNIKI